MKRLIGFLLSAVLLCMGLVGAVYAEHPGIHSTDETEKIRVLRLLEIMNGDENGDLNLDAPVTRAEFVKMTICASSYKNSAGQSLAVSLFPDVTGSHWAAGYVATAINAGLVTGYLDGTFRPENQVTLEEAVIILLKLLGYTTADFQGTYPEAQLAKYAEIDLDTDIDAVRGEALTRRECMKLLYNTLCTKTKSGAYYCTTLGYSVDADNTVDYLSLLAADMTGPFVNTDGSWKSKVSFAASDNLEVYRDGKSAAVQQIAEYDVYYYSNKLTTVWCYTDKEFGNVEAVLPNRETPQQVTVGGKTYSLNPAAAKKLTIAGGIAKDDYVMLMLDKDGAVADLVLADATLYTAYADEDADLLTEVNKTVSDPIVVTDLAAFRSKIPFDIEDAALFLDSEPISAADIRVNDVLYYSVPFRSVWVFRDTASGVCQSISPNRENPSAVVVDGKTYALSTDSVIYKFSNYGTFKTDMLVTLLLGKDGNAVDVIAAGSEVIGDGEGQVSYASVVAATLKGPYVVEKNGSLLADTEINLDRAVIYKNNKTVDVASIQAYNVYYYSKLLNTVWLYDDTAVGTVESISPARVSPTAVTVSGKTYSLESAGAQYAFSSLGSYNVGDRVTLLLGKDGAVAGVAPVGAVNKTVYGVVLGTGSKQYTDANGKAYTADYVTVFASDGETYTYEYDGSYQAGDAVKVVVGEDKVQLAGLSAPKSMSYAVAATDAVKNGRFAANAGIIEYYNSEVYGTVLPSRITGTEMSYRDIKYYKMNENGEIEILILDNYTGDLVEYGLLISVDGSTYKYIIDDAETTYSSGDVRYTVTAGAAYFVMSGTKITKIGNITGSVELTMVTGDKGYTAKNAEYSIDDHAKVYIREDGKYKVYDTDKLVGGGYTTMIGYYDKDPANGGKIRVIVAY